MRQTLDNVPVIGLSGLIAALTLENVNTWIQFGIGVSTLGYVLHRWVRFARSSTKPKRRPRLSDLSE